MKALFILPEAENFFFVAFPFRFQYHMKQ
jgi:hypothetical protein